MSSFKCKDNSFINLLFKALKIRQSKPKGTDMYSCFEEALYGKREPIKISSTTDMKLHLNSMYGMMVRENLRKECLDMFEGQQLEYADTDSVLSEWQKLPPHLLALTVQEFQEVMDDGLANGFEFRLQGSTILFREVQH